MPETAFTSDFYNNSVSDESENSVITGELLGKIEHNNQADAGHKESVQDVGDDADDCFHLPVEYCDLV